MIIPPNVSAPVAAYITPKVPGTTGDWSSLIGIVTAIIGNILISFALNTQRLAHVRLAREHGEAQEADRNRNNGKRPLSRRSGGGKTDYGSVAEERAKADTSEPVGSHHQRHHDSAIVDGASDETTSLIPALRRQGSSGSSSVLSTATAATAAAADEKSPLASKKKSYLRSPYWWAGIILMTVGEAGNFLAYGFAPASIVSPLGVVALISNCLIAPIMLKEKFRKRDLLGVVIAVGGAVTVVLSAEGSNPKLGPDEIWELVTHWEFETYLGITLGLMAVLTVLSNRYGDRTILIDLGLVGLFGGYTALSTKGVASLLSYRLWRVFTFPITYLLVAVLVVTAVLQIKYVNRALQRFDSTQVIPVQFVMFTIFVILGSAILYRDFEKATPQHIAQFLGGCALTFLGVWCITSGRTRNDDQKRRLREDGDEEDAIDLVDDEQEDDDEEEEEEAGGMGRNAYNENDDETTENEAFAQRPPEEAPEGEQSSTEAPHDPRPTHQQHPSPPSPTPRARHSKSQSQSQALLVLPPPSPPPSTALTTSSTTPTKPQQQTTRPTALNRTPSTLSNPSTFPRRTNTGTVPTLSTSPSVSSYFLRPPPPPPIPQPPAQTHARSTTRRALSQHMPSMSMSMALGPLTSPLSAGLSAVVADTLRRREYFPDTAAAVDDRAAVERVRSRSRLRERERRGSAVGDGKRRRGSSLAVATGVEEEEAAGGN